MERFSQALFNASVELNPHQIDAAVFALQSPLSQGVLLADEVGLGKTIEAGIVLCQLWAERRRKLLVICPASLRAQWAQELADKFNLPALVLDRATWKDAVSKGESPLASKAVVIMSYAYAQRMADALHGREWDLVVFDEAHKLRNAYRPSSKIGQAIRHATEGRRKLLLTATPFQNSVMELFGLASFIDPHIFGDVQAFRSRYTTPGSDMGALRHTLAGFCQRTLRRQVSEYVRYTARKALTQTFRPRDDEHSLYEAVSEFLQRPPGELSYAIPRRQRHLTQLILRKLLASSSLAIAGTLRTMVQRLQALHDEAGQSGPDLVQSLIGDEALDTDLLDEILQDDDLPEAADVVMDSEPEAALDRNRLKREIQELQALATRAETMGIDTKTSALLQALGLGFNAMESSGARRKALVFTESRRTQKYLFDFLQANGYAGEVLIFNGSNTDAQSASIYASWMQAHNGSPQASGSRAIDIRTALIDHFRDHASILIATEAAAEGVNLQFCSLVINYDLPWNPQRVEQRIGRCHRYGQRHDVVVINFFNERNHADQRVLELLADKFSLFNGVFGASDEVLGSIESGLDFERRILAIYQSCRSPQDIDAAFDKLRQELDASIQARLTDTRRQLLAHLDAEVHDRLRVQMQDARQCLDQFSRRLWDLTRFVLRHAARFDEAQLRFDLHSAPSPGVPTGQYHLVSKSHPEPAQPHAAEPGAREQSYIYRLSHPLGEHVIAVGQQIDTPLQTLSFDTSALAARVSVVQALRGHSGYLQLQKLSIDSFERQEYLLFSASSQTGAALDQESCEKLMACPARMGPPPTTPDPAALARVQAEAQRHTQATIARNLETNSAHFAQARDKLDRWADDMVLASERALAATKEQLRAAQREARLTPTLAEQQAAQEKIHKLERQQRRQRQDIFKVEDDIQRQREALLNQLTQRMSQTTCTETLFTIYWTVV